MEIGVFIFYFKKCGVRNPARWEFMGSRNNIFCTVACLEFYRTELRLSLQYIHLYGDRYTLGL